MVRHMDVVLVRWPAEAEKLERLRIGGEPRLVIVEEGTPPLAIDELEDWLRAPVDETELQLRLENLRRRALRYSAMVSVEDGVLYVGNRLVVLPPIQARLAATLLERRPAVVGRDALVRRAWPQGAPPGRNVLDVHIAKLRRLLDGTGVLVHTVHRRGYVMHVTAFASSSAS